MVNMASLLETAKKIYDKTDSNIGMGSERIDLIPAGGDPRDLREGGITFQEILERTLSNWLGENPDQYTVIESETKRPSGLPEEKAHILREGSKSLVLIEGTGGKVNFFCGPGAKKVVEALLTGTQS